MEEGKRKNSMQFYLNQHGVWSYDGQAAKCQGRGGKFRERMKLKILGKGCLGKIGKGKVNYTFLWTDIYPILNISIQK